MDQSKKLSLRGDPGPAAYSSLSLRSTANPPPAVKPRPLRHYGAHVVLEHLAHEPRQDRRALRAGPLPGDDMDDPSWRRCGVALQEELYARLGLPGVHSVKIELLHG